MSRASPTKSPKKSMIPKRKKKKEEEVPMGETDIEMKTMTMTFAISTLFTLDFHDVTIKMSEPFSEIDPKDYNTVFAQKCKECCKICDFSIKIKDVEAKKHKAYLLHHIIDVFDSPATAHYIMPTNISKFLSMVLTNISRPLPNIKPASPFDFDDVTKDLAWPHLSLVYETLLTLLSTTITFTFDNIPLIVALITNSCSPDSNERLIVRDCLSSLYAKCPETKEPIMRLMKNQFLTQNCTTELLEFFVTIIDEIQFPMPVDFEQIYLDYFIVLHSSPVFLKFCKAFFTCINHIIRVNVSLLEPTIRYITQHWPCSTIRKQLIFLSELEGLVNNYNQAVTKDIAEIVFRQLSELVNQPNIDLSETTINIILGPALEGPLETYADLAISILVQPLFNAAKQNWNEFVREDATTTLQLLSDIDENLFKKYVTKMKEERKKKKTYQQIWKTNWAKVFETAKAHDKKISGMNMDLFL